MTMRTPRQAYIDNCVLRVLLPIRDYLLPEQAVRDHMALRASPPALAAEIDDSLSYLESVRRIRAAEGETGPLWRLTTLGRDYCLENHIR